MQASTQVAQLIRQMPKVELHLHMEGAIPLDTLLSLIKKKGTEPEINTVDDLRRRFTYTDFDNFIRLWVWKNTFITSEHDFEQITYDVLRDLHGQNVKYAELTYSPGDYWRHGAPSERKGFPPQKITECIIEGKQRAYTDFGIKSALIVDLIRDHGPEIGMRRIEELSPYLDKGLVGITIGGSEQHHPPGPYAGVYRRAKELGYRLSAHAGEVCGR
jgi:adenosine deaminase